LNSITEGWGAAAAFNFKKWVGVEADFGGHYSDPANITTVTFGPRFSFRSGIFSPFVEGLAGISRLSAANLSSHTAFAGGGGGGIDLWFTRRFAVRLIQADYLYQDQSASAVGGKGRFNSTRLQGGLVLGLGSLTPPATPSASCSVQPTSLLAGEPVTATVATQNFNPKHTINYDWKTTGGKLTPSNQTATLETTGLSPGSYTVNVTATDPKGPKDYRQAACNASFTVNEPPKHPPTISCSANPTTVRVGETATVTCSGHSPDNRSLNYSWRSTGGHIAGAGATGILDTKGAAPGPITVTGTVTDDRGLAASATVTVNVQPLPPPPPQSSKLAEISFPNKKQAARVDNTAKAILDDAALRLQRDAGSKGIVVGYFDPAEKDGSSLAQQRAVNAKAYLTKEKAIDPGRLEVRTGTAGGARAEIYLVPPGASSELAGTQAFDESAVQPVKKAPARHHRHPAAKQ
jgi:hypothetical protein